MLGVWGLGTRGFEFLSLLVLHSLLSLVKLLDLPVPTSPATRLLASSGSKSRSPSLKLGPSEVQVERTRDHVTESEATMDKDSLQHQSFTKVAGEDVNSTVTTSLGVLGRGARV